MEYVSTEGEGLMLLVVFLLCLGLAGCQPHEPPLPPVPPPAEDLSTWGVAELVQPPPAAEEPLAVEAAPTPAEKVYAFASGKTFDVVVQAGMPLDVTLAPGEQVRSLFGDGLPAHMPPASPAATAEAEPASTKKLWTIVEGMGGQEGLPRPSVFVTAAQPGLTYGLIIKTTLRTYYLTLKSVKSSPVRCVRFTYPGTPAKPLPAKEPPLLPDPAAPKRWHVGYEMTSLQKQSPDWTPRGVYDDGRKMYIVLPEVTLFATAPLVRMIGPNGPSLVNAWQYLSVLIVDQLAPRLELRVGLGETAEVVTITRGRLRTIECPGDEACPVFPRAAQRLVGRATP